MLTWGSMPAKTIRQLANALNNNTTLTMLNLYSNQINEEGAQNLAQALQNNTVKQCNQIGVKGAQYMAQVIQNNTTLTTLNLAFNKIQDEGSLTKLNLGLNDMTAQGAQHLFQALKNNTTLTTLDLTGNNILTEGAQYLAQALQNNKVKQFFFSSTVYLSLCLNIDTQDTQT
ncbi:unnamed protein product [Rotaria sordida]|uniref:Uncharacterized protein n=1 Tax=Rotaria sordida TaxID=392033 RepID=A0A814ZCH4_9BILA|nr:unnamed protein product [Rotaria sordida]